MSNYTENQLTVDKNNSWSQVFELVDPDKTVLDIGCSSGNFGHELIIRKHCTVDGIDIDEKDVSLARKRLRKAYALNIETDPLDKLTAKYDIVLMMDVIEHLVNPVTTLKKVTKLLKPDGKLIFSVPNMAHISVRLDLLLGNLSYRNTGLLDDTHLHFYTEKTLLRVLGAAGYSVDRSNSTTVTYPKQLLNLKLAEGGLRASPKFVSMIGRTKGNVYQFIGVASPSRSEANVRAFPAKNPHEEHYIQIETAMNDQAGQITRLNAELDLKDQHITNLEAQLAHIQNTKSYKMTHAAMKPLHTVRRTIDNKRRH
jgi:2-polyprenyl-3-methyl-5-hydroxy-6-metoxy-1,4-benzoquinol methylase